MYLDGPRDKLFNLISVDSLEADSKITGDLSISAGMPWLSGKSIANLNQALAKSTTETLIDHGRPVRSILLPTLNANVMGQLMMHFMLETIAAADMLGINAFDQPAVEFIKASSFTKMGA